MNYIHTIKHEKLLSKYWAAREMANTIQYEEYPMDNYYGGNFYFSEIKFINYLTQMLKKEWFRNADV